MSAPSPLGADTHGLAQRLAEAEGRYRALAQATGQVVWTATAEGFLKDATLWCAYTGQRLEEGGARRGAEGWIEAVHPDDRARVREVWTRALASTTPCEAECRIRRSDGVYRPFLVRGAPVLDLAGGDAHPVCEWVVCCADITARVPGEEPAWPGEARYRRIVEAAQEGIWQIDAQGHTTYVNHKMADLLGYHVEEIQGQLLVAFLDVEERAATLSSLERRRQGIVEQREARLMRKDGGYVWVLASITPLFDEQGHYAGALAMVTDITQRKRAEQERDRLLAQARQAEAEAAARAHELEVIVDAIGDSILVYDRDGQVIRANAASRAFNPWLNHPDYRARPFAERVALATPRAVDGRPLPLEEWPVSRVLCGEVLIGSAAVDMLLRQPNGREAMLNVTGAPLRDTAGQIVGAVIVNRDVTARRRLEQRTQEALDALLHMAQTVVRAPGGMDQPVADTARAVGQRLVELTRQVLGCQRISIITVEPQTGIQHPLAVVGLTAAQEQMWRATSEGIPLAEAERQAPPDLVARFMAGEVLIADMTKPPYCDQPNPLGVRTVLAAPLRVGQDIIGILSYDYGGEEHEYTPEEVALAEAVAKLAALVIERERLLREREEARANELALQEANRRMEAFLAVASHELRTPLASIRGSLQLMQRRLDRAVDGAGAVATDLAAHLGRLAPLLNRAIQQSGVLNELVDDLVDMARIEAGELHLHLAPGDLVALVAQTVEEQQELAAPRAIHLHVAAPRTVWVHADADRLEQVVRNYLSNALKYSAEDQPVAVGVEVDGAAARVWVRDRGPGVPVADQKRIWDRFSRVETTGHRSGSSIGLGLGLYISRTIVERHHGQVGVESVPGEGATFWFTVPVVEVTDAVAR